MSPISSTHNLPSGVHKKFPGWGSAWRNPDSSSCARYEFRSVATIFPSRSRPAPVVESIASTCMHSRENERAKEGRRGAADKCHALNYGKHFWESKFKLATDSTQNTIRFWGLLIITFEYSNIELKKQNCTIPHLFHIAVGNNAAMLLVL